MDDDSYRAEDALRVAQIGRLRADSRHEELAQAYFELVAMRMDHGAFDDAQTAVGELLALTANAEDRGLRLHAEHLATLIALRRGDAAKAAAHAEWTVARARALGYDGDLPHMLFMLARSLQLAGRPTEARSKFEEALEQFEATDQPQFEAWTALALSSVVPRDQERDMIARAVDAARRSGDERAIAQSLLSQGCWHAERDQYLPARRLLEKSMASLDDAEDHEDAYDALVHLTWLHVRARAHDQAEISATELLARATTPEQCMAAHEARGIARHRKHDHAGARGDFVMRARLLWRSGQRAQAAIECARVVFSHILIGLHRVRLLRNQPSHTDVKEMLVALLTYVVLGIGWSMLCMASAAVVRRYLDAALIALLEVVAFAPLVALMVVILLDAFFALRKAKSTPQLPP